MSQEVEAKPQQKLLDEGEGESTTTATTATSSTGETKKKEEEQNMEEPSQMSKFDEKTPSSPIEEGMMQREESFTPVVDPFEEPTSHLGFFVTLKMILVGLVFFLPRLIFSLLIVLWMYITSLIACAGCCESEKVPVGGFDKWPNPRSCLRMIFRIQVRILLFVWGYYWICTEDCQVEKTKPGQHEPSICVFNHTSFVDPLVAFVITGGSFIGKSEAVEDAPIVGRIGKALQFIAVKREDPNSRHHVADELKRRGRWSLDQDKKILDEHGVWAPTAIFPEGTCTSGKALTVFKRGAFLPCAPVRAIAIEFPNWWCDVAWCGGISGGGIFCRLMCQVFNRVNVKYLGDISPPELPEPEKRKEEDEEEAMGGMVAAMSNSIISTGSADDQSLPDLFSEKVRGVFAKALNRPVTEHSFDDVRLEKTALKLFGTNVHLTKELQLSSTNIKLADAENLLKEFAEADVSKDGHLNLQEFMKLLKIEDESIAQDIFNLFDYKKHGEISFKDFLRSTSLARINKLRSATAVSMSQGGGQISGAKDKLEDAFLGLFASMDENHDKKLDRKEWQTHICQIIPGIEQTKVDAIFDLCDENKDGSVSIEEFLKFTKTHTNFAAFIANQIALYDIGASSPLK